MGNALAIELTAAAAAGLSVCNNDSSSCKSAATCTATAADVDGALPYTLALATVVVTAADLSICLDACSCCLPALLRLMLLPFGILRMAVSLQTTPMLCCCCCCWLDGMPGHLWMLLLPLRLALLPVAQLLPLLGTCDAHNSPCTLLAGQCSMTSTLCPPERPSGVLYRRATK